MDLLSKYGMLIASGLIALGGILIVYDIMKKNLARERSTNKK